MQDTIKNICNALQMEAETVKSYTDKIKFNPTEMDNIGVIATFIKNQLDAVAHIQNLTIELTNLMSEEKMLTGLTGGEEDEQS